MSEVYKLGDDPEAEALITALENGATIKAEGEDGQMELDTAALDRRESGLAQSAADTIHALLSSPAWRGNIPDAEKETLIAAMEVLRRLKVPDALRRKLEELEAAEKDRPLSSKALDQGLQRAAREAVGILGQSDTRGLSDAEFRAVLEVMEDVAARAKTPSDRDGDFNDKETAIFKLTREEIARLKALRGEQGAARGGL